MPVSTAALEMSIQSQDRYRVFCPIQKQPDAADLLGGRCSLELPATDEIGIDESEILNSSKPLLRAVSFLHLRLEGGDLSMYTHEAKRKELSCQKYGNKNFLEDRTTTKNLVLFQYLTSTPASEADSAFDRALDSATDIDPAASKRSVAASHDNARKYSSVRGSGQCVNA